MKTQEVYNEAIDGDEGFPAGDGYPTCEGGSCANMADVDDADADTMAGDDTEDIAPEREEVDELQELKDRYLRLQAEFDNYRKRTIKEKMDLVQSGGRDVLLALLPVRDDVERAVVASAKSEDIEALREGLQLISNKFTEALRQRGVTEIEVLDKPFDEECAEAIARFSAGEDKTGTVIDVVQSGYMLGDKILRFAKVVVGE